MRNLQKTCVLLVYTLLYCPIVVLILNSFNKAHFSLAWHGFSLHWYRVLLEDKALWQSFLHSLALGLSASLISTLTGLLACVTLFLRSETVKHKHTMVNTYHLMALLIIIPDIISGVSLLVFFNLINMPLGFFTLLIAHVTFCIPFVVFTIISRIKTIDVMIYFSALDLGATHWMALVKILLPLLWPALLSAFLLCFTMSFDDVIVSYFVAGPEFNILPLTIYSLVRAGVTPELNALCSITLIISIVPVILSYRLAKDTQ